jgi:hypothetical protein
MLLADNLTGLLMLLLHKVNSLRKTGSGRCHFLLIALFNSRLAVQPGVPLHCKMLLVSLLHIPAQSLCCTSYNAQQ